jgi:hypothetical protein
VEPEGSLLHSQELATGPYSDAKCDFHLVNLIIMKTKNIYQIQVFQIVLFYIYIYIYIYIYKGRTLPVTDLVGSQDCEMSRLPHFIDRQLTGGSEVVSLVDRLPFAPNFKF